MKIHLNFLLPALVFFQLSSFSQEPGFNRVTAKPTKAAQVFTSIVEDEHGYIWLTSFVGGLHKYDGSRFITYTHDPHNPNSLASNWTECIGRDSANFIWIGTWGHGLDRFDPATNIFKHFRHDPNNNGSILNDTITAILIDHTGKLWVSSAGGLDLFNEKTWRFTHYPYVAGDTTGLSSNEIRVLYEDRNGTLWVGCGSPFTEDPSVGGLNRFNKTTGKFTRYMHDPNNPNSIENNKVLGLLEDSKGNFWVGTSGDGLHIMDRNKGTFTHYHYDATHPEKLSRPPINKDQYDDHISFIKEDATGAIWIGSFYGGINRYDPDTKKITHFGNVMQGDKIVSKDVVSGFAEFSVWYAFVSQEGLLWVSANVDRYHSDPASLYSINISKTIVPYYPIDRPNANSFYYEPHDSILWIATGNGLIKKDFRNQKQEVFLDDPGNANYFMGGDGITAIKADEEGKLWIAAYRGGLSRYDPALNRFINYKHDSKKPGSLSSDKINGLYMDHNKNLWVLTEDAGIDKIDRATGTFFNYTHINNDTNSLSSESVNCMTEDLHSFWVGTSNGVDRLDNESKKFRHYLPELYITSICVDASGITWIGTPDSLYRYNAAEDKFVPFISPHSFEPIKAVLNIVEDDEKNLWISTTNAIIRINSKRDEVNIFGESYGVNQNTFNYVYAFKASNGELFLGDQNGYYAFFPSQLKGGSKPPRVNLTSFKIRDKEIRFLPGDSVSSLQAKEIKLRYNENTFSFDFIALHYDSPGDEKYLIMLENYDDTWHDIGAEHKAYFSNVPPGTYVFRIKAINADGTWQEKEVKIIITPPWYTTWWAYTLYAVLFLIALWTFIKWRVKSIRQEKILLEKKVASRTHELEEEKEKVESTLSELKSTQQQLIQSEKMASLGELTAGIAHEIQNPLNFVNNFSEVNIELVDELEQEADKGNIDEVKSIVRGIKENEEKINHHGKRADAIVKGMLQHSQKSSGQKEPTDINKLVDEYLRLSYHGMRAKDKLFNATIQTDFDNVIDKINIIPQDIGRVLLNLYNNAFYAINEKKKTADENYQPTVSIQTKKINNTVEIKVSDNGNGIPQNIVDKVFQPFFTTKPTGQGTGLGLSLSYDIMKAHRGEIKVETKEGKGTEFIIQLPIT